VAALKGEVRHLKLKVRGHQDETCQLSEKLSDIERLIEKEQQQLHDQLCTGQQQVRKHPLFRSSPSLNSTSPLEGAIDQLNSDLEAVKQAHQIDAERWSRRSVLLHSRLKQNNSELSQMQSRLKDRESEVTKLKGGLSQQHMAAETASLLCIQLSISSSHDPTA